MLFLFVFFFQFLRKTYTINSLWSPTG